MTPCEYERWLSQAWAAAEPATGCVTRITERLVRAAYAQQEEPSAAADALTDLRLLRRAVPRRNTASDDRPGIARRRRTASERAG